MSSLIRDPVLQAPVFPSGQGSRLPPRPTGSVSGIPPCPTGVRPAPLGSFSRMPPAFLGISPRPSSSFSVVPLPPPSGTPLAPSGLVARAFTALSGSLASPMPSGAFSGVPHVGSGTPPPFSGMPPRPSGLPPFSGAPSRPSEAPTGAPTEVSGLSPTHLVQARDEPSLSSVSLTGRPPKPTGSFSGDPSAHPERPGGFSRSGCHPAPTGPPPLGAPPAPSGTPGSLIQTSAELSFSAGLQSGRPPRPSGAPSFSGIPPTFSCRSPVFSGGVSGFAGRPTDLPPRPFGT